MKTTEACQYPEPIKGFHTVEFFRKIKRQLSRKMNSMTDEEYRLWVETRQRKYAARLAAGKAFGL